MHLCVTQKNMASTGISEVRESVTLLSCLQQQDCEAVSVQFVSLYVLLPILCGGPDGAIDLLWVCLSDCPDNSFRMK